MSKLKQATLALVSAGLLSVGLAGTAQADVLASSVVNITNLRFNDVGTGTQQEVQRMIDSLCRRAGWLTLLVACIAIVSTAGCGNLESACIVFGQRVQFSG